MANKTEKIELRVTEEDKAFIINKAKELGFKTTTAFLIDSAKTYFRLNTDMSVYRGLTKEINYIGHNINNVVRRMNTDGFYTDMEIDQIKTKLNSIYDLMNHEYKRLTKMKFNFTSDKLDLKTTTNLINSMKNSEMKIPKELIYEEIFERINNDIVYIIGFIESSKEQEKEVSDFTWDWLYDGHFFKLEESLLISFWSEIFIFSEKLKTKSQKYGYEFTDDDWFEFKDILDKYTI